MGWRWPVSKKASNPPVVVLLHGFGGIGLMNRPLGVALRRQGYAPIVLAYDSWGMSLEEICDWLQPQLVEIDEASTGPVHIVAHSMGGLVARALVHRRRPRKLGRVVMLGTPNSGSEIADFLDQHSMLRPILGRAGPALVTNRPMAVDALMGDIDYPVGVIAGSRPILPSALARLVPSPNDGKVSVESTRLADATDHIVLPLAHSLLPYHPASQRQIRCFLENGHFRQAGS